MKSLIKYQFNHLLQSPLFRQVYWFLRSPFSNYAAFAFFKERTARDLRTDGQYRVLNGPYKGMRYTKHGSSVSLNCLTGSYEMEIWPVLDSLRSSSYDMIIDVGCAEGYHACGMALISGKTVKAYDLNPIARQDCQNMSRINNLTSQVEIGSLLTRESLEDLCSKNDCFIFCDIDYAEVDLLDPTFVPSLIKTDILVETHGHAPDSPDDTLPTLQERFGNTHDIELFSMKPRFPYMLWDLVEPSSNHLFQIGKVVNEPLCHAYFEERGWNNWLWLKAKQRSI